MQHDAVVLVDSLGGGAQKRPPELAPRSQAKINEARILVRDVKAVIAVKNDTRLKGQQ